MLLALTENKCYFPEMTVVIPMKAIDNKNNVLTCLIDRHDHKIYFVN